MTQPLAGIAVVDCTRGVMGRACASWLANLGATVTRIPPPDDWLDDLDDGPTSTGRCLRDAHAYGVTVEASSTVALHVERVLAAAASCDVLVCDWNPGRATELGISSPELRSAHPGLVIVAATPYGLSGPDADRPATELTVYHAGGEGYLLPMGLVHAQVPDRPPVRAARFLGDEDAGLTAAAAAVIGLVRRAADGAGALLDVSAVEVQLSLGRTTLGRAFFENADFDRTYTGYDYAGVLRCTDGWICVRPSEEHHWSSLCAVAGRPELAADPRFATRAARFANGDALNAELELWSRSRPRSEVRAAILAAGCPGGPYLEPKEVLTDAAIGSRGLWAEAPGGGRVPVRPFAMTRSTPDDPAGLADRLRNRLSGTPGRGSLRGLRVLDFTWVAAGPYASELLAFAGADVVKVESRTNPDLFRRPLEPGGDLDGNIRFVDLNQGKRSVCLDLKSASGRAAVLRLAARSDVVLDNFRPGVRDRLGIGDDTLRTVNPALVIVAMSGFGADAVDADRPGYASVFSAESGLSAMTGWPDCPPADVRDTNDLRAGTVGALAAAAGLVDLLRSGGVSTFDTAARDALVLLQSHLLLQASRGKPVTRHGNGLDEACPYGVFRCRDGWLALGVVTEVQWSGLRSVISSLPSADRAERLRTRAEMEARVGAWCHTQDVGAAEAALLRAGVPAARSAAAGDIRRDPHLNVRHALPSITHPRLGSLTVVGPPWRVADEPLPSAQRPPLLGEHDVDVLTEAGLAPEEIAVVRADAGAVSVSRNF